MVRLPTDGRATAATAVAVRSPPRCVYRALVRCCLAIDIGGTKLAAALVTDEGVVIDERRLPTPAGDDPEALFACLVALCEGLLGADGSADGSGDGSGGGARTDMRGSVEVCGVGCGGPMTRGGEEVSPLNIKAWRGFPLRRRLEEATGLVTFVDNDAKALALAEGWVGAAAGCADFIAMVVSTGVGGGIVLDGRLLDGAEGNAGHIGHVIVEPEGRLCACGARGCLEAEASGTAIAAASGGRPVDAGPEVVARTGRLVGRALASVVSLLDLRLAVIGGSVALGFGEPFFAAARAELEARAQLDYARGARIVASPLGSVGGLLGGAAVGWRGLGVPTSSPALPTSSPALPTSSPALPTSSPALRPPASR
jgi:glucokinase